MNTRFVTFSLATAVGVCFAASQLKADDSVQTDEVTQDVGDPLASDQCGVDRSDPEAWMICEGWMPYEEANAVDEVIERTVAEETEPQCIDTTLADKSDGFVCADESVEPNVVAEETAADELLESDEVASGETEQAVVDRVPITAEAALEDFELQEEGVVDVTADEGLIEEFECVEGFDGWIVERDVAANDLVEEEFTVGETVEAAEIEDDAESTIEEAICDDMTDDAGNEETIDVEASVVIAKDDGLTVEPTESDGCTEGSDEVQAVTEESIEEEATIVEEAVEALESVSEEVVLEDVVDDTKATGTADTEVTEAVATEEEVAVEADEAECSSLESAEDEVATEVAAEEEAAVEETVAAAEEVASPVAVETIDEEGFVQEAVEEVQVAIDAYEDAASDGVVDSDDTLEAAEPLSEEAELQETESECTAANDLVESDSGTVRTFELGSCKITIRSERQMDDFELLSMLWEAVDQLEAEMD